MVKWGSLEFMKCLFFLVFTVQLLFLSVILSFSVKHNVDNLCAKSAFKGDLTVIDDDGKV